MIDEGYTITRAPCPQQMDDTSCGALAVSMAIRRMNGQQLGGWDDPVMPTRIRLDILQLFDQCKDVAHVDLPLCIAVPPKEDPCDIIEVKQDVVLGVPATPTSPLKRKFSNGELNARSTRMRPGS
ncbi:hypothetical protein ANO11243_091250 [Dothideomycetidae sp. 11243]|nr:hypothetical protein ANO11243_091250 [fungal sp. No.11243]